MKEVLKKSTDFYDIPVSHLRLDPDNPRLPEEADGWTTSELVEYFHREHALDEIIESMLTNGFFRQEALLVLSEPDPSTDQYIVVEGNRRLASLMFIHGAVDDYLPDPTPTDEQLGRLERIPCIAVESREEVRTYLGFRHIGGIKDWSPEAKARFVALEIERFVDAEHENPFQAVGRAYGSNAQGIRNAYIALVILRFARIEYGLETRFVQHHRFGVWQRCLNSATIREYIGFGKPRTHSDILAALNELDSDRLSEIIGDLSPPKDGGKPLISDSRSITDYGKVLLSKPARSFLREYGDLEAAVQVIRIEDLPKRIQDLSFKLKALVDEVIDAPYSEDLGEAVHSLWREVRKMRTEVTSKEDEAHL